MRLIFILIGIFGAIWWLKWCKRCDKAQKHYLNNTKISGALPPDPNYFDDELDDDIEDPWF